MVYIFQVVFYQPLFNLLVFIYNLVPGHDIGVAIIILTILIKIILYPFSLKTLRSQKAMQELQPKIDALKEKFKNQKEKMASEMMKLYQTEKINPFSSCLPLLIQLPFLIAVYQVFQAGLTNHSLDLLYPFVANPGQINPSAFGFLDLSKKQVVLAFLAGAAQYWQAKMLPMKKPTIKSAASKDESMTAMMNKQMTVMMPIMTVVIGFTLPGGLMLYWLVNSLLTIAQQFFSFREKKPAPVSVTTNTQLLSDQNNKTNQNQPKDN